MDRYRLFIFSLKFCCTSLLPLRTHTLNQAHEHSSSPTAVHFILDLHLPKLTLKLLLCIFKVASSTLERVPELSNRTPSI